MSEFKIEHELNYVFSDRKRANLRHRPIPESHTVKKFDAKPALFELVPSKFSLQQYVDTMYDQGSLGSCVAQSMAASINIITNHKNKTKSGFFSNAMTKVNPSRLYIYWHARATGGFPIQQDTGSTIYAGSMAINEYRVCDESMWSYDVSKFNIQPNLDCYNNAATFPRISHIQVEQDVNHIKQALHNNHPVAFGVAVYDSFMSLDAANSGMIPMPKNGERVRGGHALCMVGWDDEKKSFIFQNSWSKHWGDNGYGYIPYDYIINDDLAGDIWAITWE